MVRNTLAGVACTAMIVMVLWAQDKPGAPAASGATTKLVSLASNERLESKQGALAKDLAVDTDGYSEVRFTFYARPPAGKKFSKNGRSAILINTFFDNMYGPQVMRKEETALNPDYFADVTVFKVVGKRVQIRLFMGDVGVDSATVWVNAYLVR